MATDSAQAAALIQAKVDIAVLQAQNKHLVDAIEDIRLSNAAQTLQLKAIQELLSEARGGWRMMMLMGGAGAMLGGVMSWIGQHINWKG